MGSGSRVPLLSEILLLEILGCSLMLSNSLKIYISVFFLVIFARGLVWSKAGSPFQEAELTTLGFNRKPQGIAGETTVFL